MLSKREYPLRNYDVISRPPKTEGQYKISVASDSIFLPCLRGGAEGGGVTNRGSNTKPPFSNLVLTYSSLVLGEVPKAEGFNTNTT